jgi:hypothetical protein
MVHSAPRVRRQILDKPLNEALDVGMLRPFAGSSYDTVEWQKVRFRMVIVYTLSLLNPRDARSFGPKPITSERARFIDDTKDSVLNHNWCQASRSAELHY